MAKETVLVVEDNPLNMKLVKSLLTLADYRVLEATDGEAGLLSAREQIPDLILMDIQLPDMDGLAVTKQLKADPVLASIPIIALTSYAMRGDEERALAAGCVGYLTKPIDSRKFLNTISGYLRKNGEAVPQISDPGQYTILIVDDEPLNVKLVAAQLAEANYGTVTARNGQEALRKVREHKPDLVLLDILMPEMDGFEVTQILKADKTTQHIPIILVTSMDGIEDKARGMSLGADEFLNKPVNKDELLARVRSLLRLRAYKEQLDSRAVSQQSMITPFTSETSSAPDTAHRVVLIVEDDEKDLKLIRAALAKQPYHTEWVSLGEDAIELVESKKIDVVILDLLLPGIDGFDICRRLKNSDNTRNVQILILTSLTDMESRITGVELGADDYLSKPVNNDELVVRVRALLRRKAYLDQLSDRFENALHAAIIDRLTGLYNNGYLRHYMEHEIRRCRRQKQPLGLIMFDIDDFKVINDTWGHPAGDAVLREIGALVRDTVRDIDLAARYGGEEFAVVLPYEDCDRAETVAERIRRVISEHAFVMPDSFTGRKITVSLGVACYSEHAHDVSGLIEMADKQLYRAKKEGKNRVCVANGPIAPVVVPKT